MGIISSTYGFQTAFTADVPSKSVPAPLYLENTRNCSDTYLGNKTGQKVSN